MNENVQGKTFLQVVSIIMIVGGALSLLITGCGACAVTALAAGLGIGGLWMAYLVFGLLASVIELVAGIIGVMKAGKPGRPQICIVLGVIMIVFSLLSNILYAVDGYGLDFFSLILGLALPVLYVIAAMKKQ